jgi:hypothetical protein
MTRPRPIRPPIPLSLDYVIAQENAMSTDGNASQDPNATQNQAGQAPQAQQAGQQANPGGTAGQAPQGGQAQQLDPQQAEQVARNLIENHPHVLAQVFGHEGAGAPAGAVGAGGANWLSKLPQIIAIVQAIAKALQDTGVFKAGA